jgi:hypothetical protein
MCKNRVGVLFLGLAASIAVFTVVAHMSCIFIGESCYRAQLAPEPIIQSAINGTLLAPLGTIFISSLFIICAAYALSAANLIVKLPLLKIGVYTISTLCLLRGIATIPLSLLSPVMVSHFFIFAGVVWFISGLLFLFGFRFVNTVIK